jgi:hypothetical protein
VANVTITNIPGNIRNRSKRKAVLNSARHQKWIDEALSSGPISALAEKEMDAIRDRVLKIASKK